MIYYKTCTISEMIQTAITNLIVILFSAAAKNYHIILLAYTNFCTQIEKRFIQSTCFPLSIISNQGTEQSLKYRLEKQHLTKSNHFPYGQGFYVWILCISYDLIFMTMLQLYKKMSQKYKERSLTRIIHRCKKIVIKYNSGKMFYKHYSNFL